jgi:alpha-glucosidase
VLAFARDGLLNVTNFGSAPVALPAHDGVLLSSSPLDGDGGGGLLPGDATVWLRPIP